MVAMHIARPKNQCEEEMRGEANPINSQYKAK